MLDIPTLETIFVGMDFHLTSQIANLVIIRQKSNAPFANSIPIQVSIAKAKRRPDKFWKSMASLLVVCSGCHNFIRCFVVGVRYRKDMSRA